jgi:glycosyltransferase involved in cell wall biosynthesis
VRTVLFHRKYRRFHGGHLKVWNYFNHVIAATGFDARVLFDENSSWDASNPWTAARDRVIGHADEIEPDVLFIAGRDWQRLEGLGVLDRGLPVINFIQHSRHAEDWSVQSRYLGRKAIRICVAQDVADAVVVAGSNGPTFAIPNGVDVPLDEDPDSAPRPVDLLIAGLKQPALAVQAANALAAPGRTVDVLTELVPRDTFLAALRRTRVTLFLPNEREGFYLPTLEGMALGTIVVCPAYIGNRSFCTPGHDAFSPEYRFEELIADTESALAMDEAETFEMRANARETARRHSLEAEREAFHRILADIDRLWAG